MTLPSSIQKITVGQIVHFVSMFGGIIAVIYVGSGPILKPYVAQAFSEMLKEQGVDPQVFKKLQDQSVDNRQQIEELVDDVGRVQSDVGKIVNQQLRNEEKLESIENLVEKLLTIQLKRADFTPSPPGTGPANIPTLE